MGVPLRVATATSNLMIGITAAASAVIYLLRGGIDPYVAGPTAIGVFLGATAGSRFGHRVDLRYLRLLFVVVLRLHRLPDAAEGVSDERRTADDRARPRTSSDAIGRLLIAVTYVAVGAPGRSACVLMVADGISPLAAARRSTSASLGADIVAPRPGGLPVARPAGRPRRPRSAVSSSPAVGYARESDWLMVGVSVGDPAGHRGRRR